MQSSSNQIRAFFAIEISNDEALNKVLEYQEKLQKSVGPLKLVDKSLMHLTMKFLGNIDNEVARELYHFVDQYVHQDFMEKLQNPIDLKLKGVGNFGKNVYFVKVEGDLPTLTQVHDIIESRVRKIPGIKQDNKKFSPHLTIARARRGKKMENPGQVSYPKLKNMYKDVDFGSWKVERIVLKKSVLTPKGPIYSNLVF